MIDKALASRQKQQENQLAVVTSDVGLSPALR
jgi:hypothetical protein